MLSTLLYAGPSSHKLHSNLPDQDQDVAGRSRLWVGTVVKLSGLDITASGNACQFNDRGVQKQKIQIFVLKLNFIKIALISLQSDA